MILWLCRSSPLENSKHLCCISGTAWNKRLPSYTCQCMNSQHMFCQMQPCSSSPLLKSTSAHHHLVAPAGMNGQLQQQDYSRGLNSSQLGSDNLSSYLQHQGLIQPPTYNPQMQSTNSLEALLRNTALVQQLQNNGLTQSSSSNSLSGQYAEPQLRASASSGNLSMGGNSPPQLPSAHGSRQFLNQAHVGGGLGGG